MFDCQNDCVVCFLGFCFFLSLLNVYGVAFQYHMLYFISRLFDDVYRGVVCCLRYFFLTFRMEGVYLVKKEVGMTPLEAMKIFGTSLEKKSKLSYAGRFFHFSLLYWFYVNEF